MEAITLRRNTAFAHARPVSGGGSEFDYSMCSAETSFGWNPQFEVNKDPRQLIEWAKKIASVAQDAVKKYEGKALRQLS